MMKFISSFLVKNHTDKQLRKVSPQFCLALDKSNDFNPSGVTTDIFVWVEGKVIES